MIKWKHTDIMVLKISAQYMNIRLSKVSVGANEMAQLVKALPAETEDLTSISRMFSSEIHMYVHSLSLFLSLSKKGSVLQLLSGKKEM